MPPLPKIGQGFKGGAPPILQSGLPPIPTVDPKMAPHIHPHVSAQPIMPLGPPVPEQYGPPMPTAPTPQSPFEGQQQAATELRAQSPGRILKHKDIEKALNKTFDTGKPPTIDGQPITAGDLKASGFVPHTNKAQQIASGFAGQLVAMGPGLLKASEGFGKDIHNAARGDESFSNTRAIGGAIEHSFGETFNHPIRQWQQDPATFLENTVALPFLAAKGVSTAAELSKASELAAEAGTSTTRQVAKTLIRPQPQARSINAQFGEGATPMNITPPAYKSALGGYLQTKMLDPILERHLAGGNPFHEATARMANRVAGDLKMTGANRFGRKVRQDMEDAVRIRSQELTTRMGDEQAGNYARGKEFLDRHQQIYDSGASFDQIQHQPWRDWSPIKEPNPELPKTDPEYWTAKDLKNHPSLSQTEKGLSDQFDKGSKLRPTDKEEAANPDNYRYVPTDMLKSLKTYKSGTGHLQTVANTIDRGTQIIRSGRFLTPAYAQWAVQNGLLHVSQAGAFVFRNAHQLKSEFPKASAETKAAIDGGTGKGIARASVGGASAQGMKISQKMTKIQEFWHKFDDQWARRMSAIHELNSHGYHDAAAWDKLRTTNPQRFRQIVAGHASREAINYSEMTPAERATFQKLFTAYGWTRGASTYAGRFYLQHPAQAAVGTQLANQEGKQADEWWRKLGGVAPSYLKESLPVMGGMLGTQWLSPTGTLGGLIEATPGATGGSTQNLSGELAPVPAALEEGLRGQTEYGQQLRGNEQVTKPITDLIGRFRPAGALQTIGGQKMGGTFKQGPEMGALKLAGVPYQQMKDPKQTAALGLKDYESSLSIPDKIRFQLDWKQRNLPDEMALYKHATGEDAPGKMISALKSDWDAVEQRDLFQHHFAQAAHSKTWKGLTPTARLQGTIQWMQDHGHNHSQLQQAQQLAKTSFVDDAEIDQVVNALWKGTGIGQVEAAWKTIVKGLQPHVVSK